MTNGSLQAAAAASNQANASVFDYIGTLSIATKITTVIGLAALAILCAFVLSRLWLVNRSRAVEQAIGQGEEALTAVLGNNISLNKLKLEGLSQQRKLEVIRTELRQRFWSRLTSQALMFFALLAVLTFFGLLLRPKPAAAETAQPVDTISMTNLLKFVPEASRQVECVKSPGFSAELCARIVASIAGVYIKPDTPEVKTAVVDTISSGKITPALATAISRVSVGVPSGWDVDFFWCDGNNAARNKAAAEAGAAALAQTPGEKLTPSVRLGTIQVMARASHTQVADAPQAGTGAFILSDASTGKSEAVDAILSTLSARGQARYKVLNSATPKRWYVQIFDCSPPARLRGIDNVDPTILNRAVNP